MKKLGLIVPCYNEEESIEDSTRELILTFKSLIEKKLISDDSFMIFIDDGSTDKTWLRILESKKKFPHLHALRFSKNFGHQNALWAGLQYCLDQCDINICIDADLQHDISKIENFILENSRGAEIVLGMKDDRNTDHVFKKRSAELFYRVMRLMGSNVYYNHADFRLLSNEVTTKLLQFEESNLFIRGLIPMLGYSTATVSYKIQKRKFGKSKYSLAKMISFAWSGITSTTTAPLRFFSSIGILIFLLSLVQSIYVVVQYFKGHTIPGWASTVIPLYFIGGVQLISLGVTSEYIGKIYLETKRRPKFIICDKT